MINDWFKQNSWNLLVTGVTITLAFSMLSFRVKAVEDKVKDYPSQDWFELKFQTIEDNMNELKNANKVILKEHLDLKEHEVEEIIE